MSRPAGSPQRRRRDAGASVAEILVVLALLGLVAVVVVSALGSL